MTSLSALLFIVLSAAAADPAEVLIRQGVELRRGGQDEQALDKFQRAYEMAHSPRAAAQLGLCEQALGNQESAELHLTEALASSDLWIARNRRTLEKALDEVRAALVTVSVSGSPRSAVARVNDAVVGRLDAAESVVVRIRPGAIRIEASAAGYEPYVLEKQLEAGQRFDVKVDLKPLSTPVVAGGGETAAAASSPTLTATPASGDGDGIGWRQPAKWVAFSAAGLGLAAGVYGVVLNRSTVSTFDEDCGVLGDDAMALPGASRSNAECARLKDRYETGALIGAIGFGSAALLGAFGIYLHFSSSAEESPRYAACSPAMQATGLTLSCAGRF